MNQILLHPDHFTIRAIRQEPESERGWKRVSLLTMIKTATNADL